MSELVLNTGRNETVALLMNDGTAVSYEDLIAFNGYVNVRLSTIQLAVMLAPGNVGSNSGGMDDNNSGNGTGY